MRDLEGSRDVTPRSSQGGIYSINYQTIQINNDLIEGKAQFLYANSLISFFLLTEPFLLLTGQKTHKITYRVLKNLKF